jgi:threonine synthase
MTPLFRLKKSSLRYGLDDLWIKDESANPTGSFKARGLSMAVSKAKELGIQKCIIPTAGNAGGALAAYCAKAGIECTVVMPRHTPVVFKRECRLYDARLIVTDGLINDCANKVKELNADHSYFDVSTLKEPYRLEGKKTMGFEIAEQFHWQLPDVIIYPAGGGTGLIGMWKAFRELKEMGWVIGALPKMIAVQSEVCAPLVRALQDPNGWKKDFNPQPSVANGLTVPYPFGMDLMLKTIHESGGTAVAVAEEKIMEEIRSVAKEEGILLCPEGAAVFAALPLLKSGGDIRAWDKVVVMNTGSGYKYLENMLY